MLNVQNDEYKIWAIYIWTRIVFKSLCVLYTADFSLVWTWMILVCLYVEQTVH